MFLHNVQVPYRFNFSIFVNKYFGTTIYGEINFSYFFRGVWNVKSGVFTESVEVRALH